MSVSVKNQRRAVLVQAIPTEEGIRLCLDDVVCDNELSKRWIQSDHVTSKELSRSSLTLVDLNEEELADIAHYILSRLSAFLKRGEL